MRHIMFPALAVALFSSPLIALASGQREAQKPMVIVAPDRFHAALASYARFRAGQRPTELVSLEMVLKETAGADDPERLKRWLYQAWKDRGVRYALLVGDADVLPVRYMVLDRVTKEAFDYAFYPSDLYYGDVAHQDGSFDDWNGRKDDFHAGYFGEVRGEKNKTDGINFDKIDYRPEIAVGRWPVSSGDEVHVVAEKTMSYERGVADEKTAGLRRAAFVSVPGWVDTRLQMQKWSEKLPQGWTAEQFSGDSNAKNAPDEKHVAKMLNDGVSLVFHAGHGHDEGWEQSLSSATLKTLSNCNHLPVILSAGCSTARFATLPPYEPYEDVLGRQHKGSNAGEVFTAPPAPPSPYARGQFNRTGLGERLVRSGPNGAVAYIGCNTGSQPCGLTLLDGFARALADNLEPKLGDCWASAMSHYYEAEHLATIEPTPDWYPASIFFQGMKFMVFGDPALRLPSPHK